MEIASLNVKLQDYGNCIIKRYSAGLWQLHH